MSELPSRLPFVITCGDEGVQINVGRRLGFVGAGVKLDGFAEVVPHLQKLFGADLVLASSAENDWIKAKFELSDYEQADAFAQQHTELLADELKLKYAGFLPFTDPRQLKHEVKGHMVRPKAVHIANGVCFTLAGGEQTYHLGHFIVSAEWVSMVPKKLATQLIKTQLDFYQSLVPKDKLKFVFEAEGDLGQDFAKKNQAILEKILA